MAMAACKQVSEEERAWAYHLSLDRAETDYNNELMLAAKKAREQGMQQGLEQGIERGEERMAFAIARRMLSNGKYSQEEVSVATGLAVEDVRTLQGA